jgi:histidine triad (HIT) family protein
MAKNAINYQTPTSVFCANPHIKAIGLYNTCMQDSIFTKIIKGQIPCHKIYEDDLTLAFLDIHPVATGMTLVVTKAQVANFQYPQHLKIAVQVEGLDVPHVHVKLFPINTGDDFVKRADMSTDPDHAALAELAKRLAI